MKADTLLDTLAGHSGGVSAQLAGLLFILLLPVFASAQTLKSSSSLPTLNPRNSDAVLPAEQPSLTRATSDVLPVDQAFALTAVIEGDSNLILSWAITPGYYLYQDQLSILDAAGTKVPVMLPPATPLTDEFFGETQVYFDAVRLALPLKTAGLEVSAGTFAVDLRYQGCAKDRYCYPPQQRAIQLSLPR